MLKPERIVLTPIRELVSTMPKLTNNIDFKAGSSFLHGTTIASFLVENGQAIVSVSDGKVSEGPLLYPASFDFPKVVEIDERTVMLFAGSAGFAVLYSRILKNWVEILERTREEPLSTRAKVNILSRILRDSLPIAASGFPVVAILATFDQRKGARIFMFNPDGSNVQRNSYGIYGSGKVSEGSLLENWKIDMSKEDGVNYAKKLIHTAARLDSATGGNVFIKVLDKNGVESINGGRVNV